MPLYQYKCECGNTFDAWGKMDDHHTFKCKECGGIAHHVITAPNFSFGFTRTSVEPWWRPGMPDKLIRNI
jgi:putative FmdB family regulatory protein